MMKKCATSYCQRLSPEKYCSCCAKRIYRAKYPMKAAYQNLRSNAKRRRKEFSITFEDFALFCQRTQYITYKGKKKDSYSIDRPKNHLGYTLDNMSILTLSQNTIKMVFIDYDWENRIVHHRKATEVLQMEYAPF
jgi:hypothetical protein